MSQKLSENTRRGAAFKQLQAELERNKNRVDQMLAEVSIIDAGYLFRDHWEDYTSGVSDLLKVVEQLNDQQIAELATASNSDDVHPGFKPTLRRLCKLSREVTFSIDPLRISVELRSEIENLFRFTVDRVPQDIADEAARSHVRNIGRRLFTPIAVA